MSDLQFACKKTVKVEPNGISDKKPPRLQVQQDQHTAAHTSFSAAKALHLETQMQQCILQLHPKQHTAVQIHSTTQILRSSRAQQQIKGALGQQLFIQQHHLFLRSDSATESVPLVSDQTILLNHSSFMT